MVELTRMRLTFLLAVLLATPGTGLAIDVIATSDVSTGGAACPASMLCDLGIFPLLTGALLTSYDGIGPIPQIGSTTGTFTMGPAALGFSEGIVLSTGMVEDAELDHSVSAFFPFGVLDTTSPLATDVPSPVGPEVFPKVFADTTVLELDFTAPAAGSVSVDYTFATEEGLFVRLFEFLDTFAIFLEDAVGLTLWSHTDPLDDPLVPGPMLADFVFDDLNGPLSTTIPVPAAGDYTVLLAIGDAGPGIGDATLDSAAFIGDITFESSAVPEPASLLLLGSGLVGMIVLLRRRKSKV